MPHYCLPGITANIAKRCVKVARPITRASNCVCICNCALHVTRLAAEVGAHMPESYSGRGLRLQAPPKPVTGFDAGMTLPSKKRLASAYIGFMAGTKDDYRILYNSRYDYSLSPDERAIKRMDTVAVC
jgi:hypothetical protein